MKAEFIQVKVLGGVKAIARTSIATIDPYPGGSKLTLNIKDEDGKEIVVITTDSYNYIIQTLTQK